jgi:predicted permease
MATRFYELLLLLLPGWFREEFAGEMIAVFRESRADARRDGPTRVMALWMQTVRDVIALSFQLHTDTARQDASYALRTLRRTPAFTIAAIATLALGMGPTLVIANLLHNVVLRPLPFDESNRLVAVWNGQPESRHENPLSAPDYVDFRDGQSVFEALAAHAGTSVAFVGTGEPRQIAGVLTTSELFRVLRVQPRLGRPLMPGDSAPGAAPVIVLGPDFWRAEFGGRPDVIGEMVTIDGRLTEIVGVLPEVLDFPTGSRSFWIPLTLDPASFNRGSHFLESTGRLAAGVTIPQASDVMNGIARSLADLYPSTNGGNGIQLVELKRQLNGDSPRVITVLAGAVVAVLLIACTNVASLLTVRASVRGAELAVRAAIGATTRRLRQQLLVEHLMLAVGGGILAAAMALPMHRLLVENRLLALPRTTNPEVGWPAFATIAAVVVAIGIVFARIGARRSSASAGASELLSASRQTGARSQLRLRQGLVVAEVAGALVLVVVAGLMIRSAMRLAAVDPGFTSESVLTFGVVLPGEAYRAPAARLQFVDRVLERLRALPGVQAAASAGYAPMGQMRASRRFAPEDRPRPGPGAEPLAVDLPVGPGYFDVMGIPLVAGRVFDKSDGPAAPQVLVVSETFAREVFPGENAIGKRIGYYSARPGGQPPPSREIVGIVRDVRQVGVSRRPMPQMYGPYPQSAWGFTSFFVRVAGNPDTVRSSIPRVVSSVDPMRPVRDVVSTGDIIRSSTARDRAMTWMLIALAIIALLLATIGLYGVSATAASARSRELAIRAAIGARPRTLRNLILAQGLAAAVVGVILGAAASFVATRGLGALLFETQPRDPVIFVVTAALLLAIAALATYFPARRALATNPAELLRSE